MRFPNHTIDDMLESRLDFMKQRVRKESGLQKLEPENYREYQQRYAVIFDL